MQMTLTFLCLLGAAAVMAAPGHDVTAPEVATKSGRVRGVTRTNGQGVQYSEYLGIPYAKPPTGSRRFAPPEPADAWTGTRDASHFRASCPQNASGFTDPGPMDEDCLFLNVFVPQQPSGRHLPVMVFIHGGGYYIGTSSQYRGDVLCGKGVVVVTLNYRLGALGFLSTGDAVAPGNYGLLDQILALQWVKDNIAAFYGDPNKVTIFGESSGASSVSLLLLSPLTKGLFQGTIAESGSSLAPFAVAHSSSYPSQPAMALDLGAKVGCQATDHATLVACLRTKDAMALTTTNVIKNLFNRFIWQPVVERVYGVIPDNPFDMLMAGKAHPVPVISGTNRNEMAGLLDMAPNMEEGLPEYFFNIMVRDWVFKLIGWKAAIQIMPRVLEVYTKGINTSDPKALRDAYIALTSDTYFTVPSMGELLLLQTRGPKASRYLYLFDYRTTNSPLPHWQGVVHSEELFYVFGAPFGWDSPLVHYASENSTFTDMDRKMSDQVMTMWTNFATTGTPTPKAVGGVTWPAFTADSRAFLRLQSALTVDHHLRAQRFDFWSQEVLAVLGVTMPAPSHLPGLPIVG